MNITTTNKIPSPISGIWPHAAIVATTDFKFKSLCDWVFNTAVGCSHGCRFCYVPSTATNKQKPVLQTFGVNDPDAEWGKYVLVREWDEEKFLKSLLAAETMPNEKLKPEGNRAVMFCSTTDPYQVIHHADPKMGKELTQQHQKIVRRALELIRDTSTLNVRILTRSPLAKTDFELFKSFGDRLVFGMSLPTLNNNLARVYEPNAPAPSQRLETLKAAKEAGLHVYVAVAPTYPQCDEADIEATLKEVAALEPITVFHEPINIRADNAQRIKVHAEEMGVILDMTALETPSAWQKYVIDQLRLVETLAEKLGLGDRLHLWPDSSLASQSVLRGLDDPTAFVHWLGRCWTRISEWPGSSSSDSAEASEAGLDAAPLKIGDAPVAAN